MSNVRLKAHEWRKIKRFLDEHPRVYVGKSRSCKRFVEAVLWMSRSGAQWRLLPKGYGEWNSVYKRFSRWAEAGVWEGMLSHFAQDADMQSVMLDATFVRAHACAAGGRYPRSGRGYAPLGKGGMSSSIWAGAKADSPARYTFA